MATNNVDDTDKYEENFRSIHFRFPLRFTYTCMYMNRNCTLSAKSGCLCVSVCKFQVLCVNAYQLYRHIRFGLFGVSGSLWLCICIFHLTKLSLTLVRGCSWCAFVFIVGSGGETPGLCFNTFSREDGL